MSDWLVDITIASMQQNEAWVAQLLGVLKEREETRLSYGGVAGDLTLPFKLIDRTVEGLFDDLGL